MSDEQKQDASSSAKATDDRPAKKEAKKDYSNIKSGMVVKVHQKIQEVGKKGEAKERIQIFEGMVLAIRGTGPSKTITVRKMSEGVAVEKIFPIFSPVVADIEPIKAFKVRRAKLYYLREYKKKLREKK